MADSTLESENPDLQKLCGHPIGGDPNRPCVIYKGHRGKNHRDETVYSNEYLPRVPGSAGAVYFVAEWETPFIKIGRTNTDTPEGVARRVKELQTGNPRLLYPIHTVWSDNVIAEEQILHRLFASFRARENSEWFKCDREFTDWFNYFYKWKDVV